MPFQAGQGAGIHMSGLLDEEEKRRKSLEAAKANYERKQEITKLLEQRMAGGQGGGSHWVPEESMTGVTDLGAPMGGGGGGGGVMDPQKPEPAVPGVNGGGGNAFSPGAKAAVNNASAFGSAAKSAMLGASPFATGGSGGRSARKNWWENDDDQYDPSTWF